MSSFSGEPYKSIFIATDDRQKIYDTDDCSANIRASVDETYNLHFHYRIGRRICKVADALSNDTPGYRPMLENSQYDEVSMPSRVEPPVFCRTVEDQAERIIEALRAQLTAYPDEFLGILCPTRRILDQIRKAIEASDLADQSICQGSAEAVEFTPGRRIIVSTIHAAQGVEFRTVHIAGAEELSRLHQDRNVTFTAVTRAKTNLSVYHSSPFPGYFEQSIQAAQPPKSPAKLEQVFGGKKRF